MHPGSADLAWRRQDGPSSSGAMPCGRCERCLKKHGSNRHRATKGFYVAHRPSRVAELVAMQRQLKQYFGFETELIGCDALRQEYLNGAAAWSPSLSGALPHPPHALCPGTGQGRQGAWVPVHENSPVRQWERVGDRHVLRTPAGSLRAKRVVIATNAYTPDRLHPWSRKADERAVEHHRHRATDGRPTRGHQLAHPQDAGRYPPSAVLLAPTEDERILFGARGIEDTPASRAAMRLWMHEQLLARFPPGIHRCRLLLAGMGGDRP